VRIPASVWCNAVKIIYARLRNCEVVSGSIVGLGRISEFRLCLGRSAPSGQGHTERQTRCISACVMLTMHSRVLNVCPPASRPPKVIRSLQVWAVRAAPYCRYFLPGLCSSTYKVENRWCPKDEVESFHYHRRVPVYSCRRRTDGAVVRNDEDSVAMVKSRNLSDPTSVPGETLRHVTIDVEELTTLWETLGVEGIT